MSQLTDLVATANRNGWATENGDLETIRSDGRRAGWVEVPSRRKDPSVSVLQAKTQAAAAPASLSATYGLDAQPLHTDGAHIQIPPDVIVLVSQEPSPTPTRLWRLRGPNRRPNEFGGGQAFPFAAAEHGMFLVSNGRDSFFSAAMPSRGNFRFDPGCMSPCDSRAHELVSYLEEEGLRTAETHAWTTGSQVLVINNRTALHARAAIAPGDEHRILNRIAFRTNGAAA